MTLRIAYITHYAELFGANRSMLDLVMEARRRGAVEPMVILPREGPLSAQLQRQGIPFKVFPFQPWMSERHYMGGPHHRLGQFLRYRRAARDRRRANTALLPSIAAWLKEQRVQAIHANSAAVSTATMLRSAINVPLIWHIRELPERQYLLHIDAGRRAYGRALGQADQLIAISEAVRTDIQRYTDGPAPIELIYNGVLPKARYQELRDRAPGRWEHAVPFTFALVGLIHPSKGQEEAVRAIDIVRRSTPSVKLLLAGSGKSDGLKQLIATLGVQDHVDLLGFIEDPFKVFEKAHAYLMCSRNEAMGRVTVEAMASGLPVIGHASGGTLELVQDGLNGWTYPGGHEALAALMLQLVRDPALARSTGERAMSMASERFSVERMTDQVLAVYAHRIPLA